jgi:formamidopyrimidine-DNA glycosylase
MGQVITRASRVHAPSSPKYAQLERAVGKRIVDVARRGKFLLLPLVDAEGVQGWELVIHLGMTGAVKRVATLEDIGSADSIEVKASDGNSVATEPLKNTADVRDKHVRVRLELRSDTDEVSHLVFEDMRRFGRFLVVPQGDYGSLPTLNTMGLEPFDDTLSEMRFWQALQGSKTAIKTYLLSQRPVAGVGNIYADEALWEAQIHPKTPAFRISKKRAEALLAALREVLAHSIDLQGTTLRDYRTVNGEVGKFADHLHVYGKTDEPCPRCGHPIERLIIGGRSSHMCPTCQKRN